MPVFKSALVPPPSFNISSSRYPLSSKAASSLGLDWYFYKKQLITACYENFKELTVLLK
jgi:hypothetical protein